MSDAATSVLLVEDNPYDAELVGYDLRRSSVGGNNFAILPAGTLEEASLALTNGKVNVVLLDLNLPDSRSLNTLTALQKIAPLVPIVVLSGQEDEALAIQAVQAGAQDYLVKGSLEPQLLSRVLRYAIERQRFGEALQKSNAELEQRVALSTAKLVSANQQLRQEIQNRMQAEQRLQKRANHLRALNESARLFAENASEYTILLETIARRFTDLLGSGCLVQLFSADEQRLEPAAYYEKELDLHPLLRQALGNLPERYIQTTAISEAFSSGQPLQHSSAEILAWITASYRGPLPALEEIELPSIITIPMTIRQRRIGVLHILRRGAAGPFTEGDLLLASTLAESAAINIANADLFEQVRSGRLRQQILSRRLVDVQESERREIARELHDEIGQQLTGLKLLLKMSTSQPIEEHYTTLDEAQELVSDLLARVRRMSLHLRPAMLDDLGLLPALLWHFEHFFNVTHLQVHFEHSGLENTRFSPEIETAAYRIVQEALTNAARHAGVDQVWVSANVFTDVFELVVRDLGAGFDVQTMMSANSSSGLANMYERAELVGGQFTIASAPGQGTHLVVKLPNRYRGDRRKLYY